MILDDNQMIFVEYTKNLKKLQKISVIQVLEGKRYPVGKIFYRFNYETNQMEYRATDINDLPIFIDTKDIKTLKKKFRQYGRELANPNRIPEYGNEPQPTEREDKLKAIRGKNSQEQKQEVSKTPKPIEAPKNETEQSIEKTDRELELEKIREKNIENNREQEMER
ncbi:MAG: hypothetical protein WC223_13430 [Bacteroidales bacterium]|jgi:hypothetical protein